MNPDKLTTECISAIQHLDDVEAKKLIGEVRLFSATQNLQKTDPEAFERLQQLIIQLKLVALPQLTDDESVAIIRDHYLDSFKSGIDMENRLTVKLFFIPEIPRDKLREKLKRALMENRQKLGPLTIGQWIAAFEKAYNIKTRTLSAAVDFVRSDYQAQAMDNERKEGLKEILHAYDYLLVTTLPATGPALNKIIGEDSAQSKEDFSGFSEESDYQIPPQYYPPIKNKRSETEHIDQAEIRTEKIPFSEAIKKYPEINEQAVTSFRIKINKYPEPVRPSVKNWISDYTFTMGFAKHDSTERGAYLFQSQNTRSLGSGDRNQLNYLLKSFDTGEAIEVDTASKKILFPKAALETFSKPPSFPTQKQASLTANTPSPVKKPARSNLSGSFTFSQEERKAILKQTEKRLPQAQPIPRISTGKSAAPISQSANQSSRKMEFSSPHKLPFEKEATVTDKKSPNIDPLKPIRIMPSGFNQRKDERDQNQSKNVVNLKEK